MDTVALEAAVSQDLPRLHAGEGVLDASTDVPVGDVVVLFPGWEIGLAGFASVQDDQSSPPVTTVGDHRGVTDSGLCAGDFPCLAVVAVARDRSADGDNEPGVGVDDDLVVGRVAVVFRLLGDGVIAGGDQGAVRDQHGAVAEPLTGLESE